MNGLRGGLGESLVLRLPVWLNCVWADPHIEALTPMCIRRLGFKEVIWSSMRSWKWVPNPLEMVRYMKSKRYQGPICTKKRPHEPEGHRHLQVTERSQEKPTLPPPCSWVSSLQNCENRICHLSPHSVVFCYRGPSWTILWGCRTLGRRDCSTQNKRDL